MKNIKCKKCGKSGFKWNRKECMYCGELNKEIKIDKNIQDKNKKLFDAESKRIKDEKKKEIQKNKAKWEKWDITMEKGGSPIIY